MVGRSVDLLGEFSDRDALCCADDGAAGCTVFRSAGRLHRILIGPLLSPPSLSLVVEDLIIEIRHGLPSLRPQVVIKSRIVSVYLNHRRNGDGTLW